MDTNHIDGPAVLITGAAGFLGKVIVREILDPASPVKPSFVRIFDRKPYDGTMDDRIEAVIGDIRDKHAVDNACRGIDLVIHSAAIVDWGTYPDSEIYGVNTWGTENILQSCKRNGVKYLVFTSSLDAIYSGKPLVDVDETAPYPAEHTTSYCRSKYLAEKLVKESSGDGLISCILRPSDIYGEADPYHIGSLINMAKGGFYVRLGNGTAKCQHVYVGNCAYAHLLAASALMEGNPNLPGSVYFITDGPGSNFFRFFDQIVTGAGYRIRPKNLWIPRPIAYAMGATAEGIAWLARPFRKYQPKFSRFAVTYTCTSYTFNSEKARKEFGFVPRYAEAEALGRTSAYYRNQEGGK